MADREVVVITGAGKGIGRATARRFAGQGVAIGLLGGAGAAAAAAALGGVLTRR
jgi:2-hydroxycyclohexanecarboxyl-CoA dehydrogenase